MVDLRVNLCGLELDNPVVPASKTFGFGKEFSEFYDINMLGSFSFKAAPQGMLVLAIPPPALQNAPPA